MIEARNLSKYYSGHRAIHNVNFDIAEGEIIGLLGLNGAGKTTILKILGCFLLPSGGDARIAGYSVHDEPNAIRKLIGYLPDFCPSYNEMTVKAYLGFVARLKDVPGSQVRQKVDLAIEKANLKDVVKSRLGELSHGFRQRVGIAQALVHDPKVIFLDEPISGLDPMQIVDMRDLVVSLKGQHTVILSSHILSEITKTCDRILIINEGEVIAEGKESDLQAKMTRSMSLTCDVTHGDEALVQKVRSIRGVTAVNVSRGPHGGPRLIIETSEDVRSQVASIVVRAEAGLLAFHRDEAGLEGVFMKLVKPDEVAHG